MPTWSFGYSSRIARAGRDEILLKQTFGKRTALGSLIYLGRVLPSGWKHKRFLRVERARLP